jgi:hypothetical protein
MNPGSFALILITRIWPFGVTLPDLDCQILAEIRPNEVSMLIGAARGGLEEWLFEFE